MDNRIGCNNCPLFHVEVDTLCETYCSDMADYRDEIRLNTIDNYKEWLTEKGIHGSKEMKRIADMYKEQFKE